MAKKINLGKLKLKNPIILASGTFDRSISKKIDINELGAIVTKTITLKAREGNPLPHIYKTKYGWLNSVGLKNPGLKKYLSEELPFWQKYQTEIFTSISGKKVIDYISLAKNLRNVVRTIEVDVSCPNTGKDFLGVDIVKLKKIISFVRKVFPGVIIAKLAPDIYQIEGIAKLALKSGADILTIANTYPALELNNFKPIFERILAGYSGGAVKPLTLGMIYRVWQKLKCPIIASGGIENTHDVLDYLTCGAKAVEIGTANFLNPKISVKIIRELERVK